jgi:NADH dehydrogenase (ubiquinone) 1 beta subcomplex subunit 3
MAHGHGHEHGHSKLELPDYKQWKIEGIPLETGFTRAEGSMGPQ